MAKHEESQLSKREADRARSYVPMDVVEEVLLKLPVKTLLRFRAVHSDWRRCIDSPKFVDKHLRRSEESIGKHRLLINNGNFFSMEVTTLNESVAVYNPLESDLTLLGGLCRGVFLLVDYNTHALAICNPTTRQYNRLPLTENNKSLFVAYGLGYVKETTDYKVVKLSEEGGPEKTTVEAKVYSLNSNSWKKIGNLPKRFIDHSYGVYAGEALNWVFFYDEEDDNYLADLFVGSIDLAKDQYQPIPIPRFSDTTFESMNVGVLKDQLCIGCHYHSTTDLWCMKEYGIQESWTKVFTFPLKRKDSKVLPLLIPVTVTDSEDDKAIVVLQNNKEINWTYLENEPRRRTCRIPNCDEVRPYVPTLLPVRFQAEAFEDEREKVEPQILEAKDNFCEDLKAPGKEDSSFTFR